MYETAAGNFSFYNESLIRKWYPSRETLLFDDVLATFVLHHPEHGHAVVLPIISCVIDGTLVYDKTSAPFASFISLVCPKSENEYSEHWALACGEILRILTHYNCPIFKTERQCSETERSTSSCHATTSNSVDGKLDRSCLTLLERKPIRPLSPWITDILPAAPLGIRSDYFRWCSGVMGKYAAGELKPPITASSGGSGKHPQLMPSTPRWAVANGAALDEHLVAGLPALEPYARLFHRYYAIATPSATQRLLLGLLEAPPSWAPDALDAAVQLVELLRAAEDYASGIRLPRNWMHLHFLRAIGTAIKQIEVPAAEATIEAPAQGIASMLCAHGQAAEWRICTVWETAYGLIPLSSSAVDLPEIIVATSLTIMEFVHTPMEAILRRTFPSESIRKKSRTRYHSSLGSSSKNLAVAELRTMVHSLFLESCASVELASRLLFVVLTVCHSHEAQFSGSKKPRGEDSYLAKETIEDLEAVSENQREEKRYKISPVKINGSSHELQNGIDSAIRHTHRILAILEALFSLKPSSVGTSWSYSSNEIVAAAMVAAHVSELFKQSKACMHALSVLRRCKWDNEIHSRASSLYSLIDIHSKAVASISEKSGNCSSEQTSVSPSEISAISKLNCESEKTSCSNEASGHALGRSITSFPLDVSDLASFLTMDRHIGFNCSAQILLRSMMAEKQELCFSVVSLLWHKLIMSPETQPCAESTSAQQGWRQVVDALCNVVSAAPSKAATAVVLQADRELHPWIAKDDDLGQKMWRINQKIVKLIVELMRNHERIESLVIVASASDLLLLATNGMLVDGEDCTLPQLELLEATARAVQPVLGLGESGFAVVDGLSNLLKVFCFLKRFHGGGIVISWGLMLGPSWWGVEDHSFGVMNIVFGQSPWWSHCGCCMGVVGQWVCRWTELKDVSLRKSNGIDGVYP
ncbi:hypothetical protein K1719_025012 [Acacia pycnantha]|nr:hypothetical protein K1719_025012 [Acacia pycnantha]